MSPFGVFALVLLFVNFVLPILIGVLFYWAWKGIFGKFSPESANDQVSNFLKYWFWIVIIFCAYTAIGFFTEQEFTPNPLKLIFGESTDPFRLGIADLLALFLLGFLTPLSSWIYKRTKGNIAITSARSFKLISAIVIVIGLLGGGYILLRGREESIQAQVQYELRIQNNDTIRSVLAEQNSPLKDFFLNLVIQDDVGTVYFMSDAAPYLNTPESRAAYFEPLKAAIVSRVPNLTGIKVGIGNTIY
jgi:hypothetical protein